MVSKCFPGGYNVKLYISRGRLAWWLLAFLHSDIMAQSYIWQLDKSLTLVVKIGTHGQLQPLDKVHAYWVCSFPIQSNIIQTKPSTYTRQHMSFLPAI